MNLALDLQIVSAAEQLPELADFEQWVSAVLTSQYDSAALTIRLVDEAEMIALNQQYRQKAAPTNVLSFPFETELQEFLAEPLLGDIIICIPVVAREAAAQKITEQSHWAHLVIHGVLHLLGYDHIEENEAVIMENLESDIMQHLGFADPYQELSSNE